MTQHPAPRPVRNDEAPAAFARVVAAGLELPGVETDTKYDGSPRLTLGGCFLAGLATHASAEPGTLVIRATTDDRALFLADAPDLYYLTGYYRPHPVVLVRLARVTREVLRELLLMSWHLTAPKARRGRRAKPPAVYSPP